MNAFFFDMDGTVIDSRADLVETVNATRADLGLAPKTSDEVMACVGNGMYELLRKAIPEVADRFDEILPLHRKNYELHMLDHVCAYPGVERTLSVLRGAGCKLGVVTNKPNFATHAILKHLGLDGFFGDAVIAGGDGVELKPAADPLIACAAKMGHTLGAYDVMVGDNWTDVECGANAGVRTAFCDYGYGTVSSVLPTFRISSFSELASMMI